MFNKTHLGRTLETYLATWAKGRFPYEGQDLMQEQAQVQRFQQFLKDHSNPYVRECSAGHFTGSALVVDPSLSNVLLTHHRKLNKWLQLGGHADGNDRLEQVAIQEVIEESGLSMVRFLPYETLFTQPTEGPLPFDIDCHVIPARKTEPEHLHFDLRYLVVAEGDEPVVISDESHDVRWFGLNDARAVTGELSMIRQFNKLAAIKKRMGV